MSDRLKNPNLLTFFWVTLLGIAFYLTLILMNWPLLRITKMRGATDYQDLYGIFKFKECFANFGYNFTDKSIYPDCAGFVYNFQLLKILNLNILTGISPSQFHIFQLTLYSGLFAYIYAYIAKTQATKLLTLFLLFSPSSQLLLERGNLDAVMIPLIVFASLLIYRGRIFQSLILIILATMFKFYSIPIFLFAVLKAKNFLVKVTVVILFFIALYMSIHNYLLLREKSIETYCCSFGNDVFGLYLNRLGLNLNSTSISIAGWMILIFSIILVSSLSRTKLSVCIPRISNSILSESNIFLPLMLIFFVLYISGTNFDYKLQILSLAQLVYITNCSESSDRKTQIIYCLLIQVFSFPSMDLQPFGDILIAVYLASLILTLGSNYLGKLLHSKKFF